MRKHSKRYNAARTRVNRSSRYSVGEALSLLREMPQVDFDETVEVALKLGIDPRKSDQMVRGTVLLPHGTGKKARVVVFADGELAEQALKAGAVEAGGEELIEKVSKGWLEFDVAIAIPQMMSKVGRLGRLLGPKGLMPSPKSGTVTEDVAAAVTDFLAGKIEYRADSGGNLHAPVGRLSFADQQLEENLEAFTEHIRSVKPASAKGTFIRKVYLCASMSPSIPLAV